MWIYGKHNNNNNNNNPWKVEFNSTPIFRSDVCIPEEVKKCDTVSCQIIVISNHLWLSLGFKMKRDKICTISSKAEQR